MANVCVTQTYRTVLPLLQPLMLKFTAEFGVDPLKDITLSVYFERNVNADRDSYETCRS